MRSLDLVEEYLKNGAQVVALSSQRQVRIDKGMPLVIYVDSDPTEPVSQMVDRLSAVYGVPGSTVIPELLVERGNEGLSRIPAAAANETAGEDLVALLFDYSKSPSAIPAVQSGSHLQESIRIMHRLRAPGGCPWDREQSHQSLVRHLIEEAYEVVDAIERADSGDLMEELGDLLLQVLFHAEIAAEQERFTISDVAASLNEKLIRRHPHIFGDVTADTPGEVVERWESIKKQEKAARGGTAPAPSALAGVPRSFPALMYGEKIQTRAARIGFDWTDRNQVIDKVFEEVEELKEVAGAGGERFKEELGDLFFALVNVARHFDIEAEGAMRHATDKFINRFQKMEAQLGDVSADKLNIDEWELLWEKVKASEKETNG